MVEIKKQQAGREAVHRVVKVRTQGEMMQAAGEEVNGLVEAVSEFEGDQVRWEGVD